jgi:cytochrome c peroxidase
MGNTHVDVVAKINAIQGYRVLFQKSFGSPEVTIDNLAKAIATFERTLLSGNSPYDRYKAGSKTALTAAQVRGLDVVGVVIGVDQPDPDPGRYEVTKDPMDSGAFKTPTLRDVARTAPYMHDGSLKTLDDKIKPLKLTEGDKKDLVEFLKSLNGEGWQKVTAPASFPQ